MKTNKFLSDKATVLVVVGVFLISLLLNWSSFFPTLGEINPWDEAGYVMSGQELLSGDWPIFAGSPLTAALYAITGFVFSSSPFWLVHSVAAGRLIAYTMIWLCAYLLGKRLIPYTTPLVMVGILLAAPFLIKLLRFPSDPLFMAFSGFALWQLLDFRQTNRIRHVILSGVFMALAAFARNDGLVLFIAALIWLMIFCINKKIHWSALAGFMIPFISIVGGYVLFYGIRSGNFSLGTGERTYDNFEAGQIAVYSGEQGLNTAVDAKREARRLFGTPAENNYSVFRAITRNPQAYMERLLRVTRELPGQVIKAYTGKWVVLLAFWAIWGVVTLFRKHDWLLLTLFLFWFTPFFSGFVITIFRTGHLLFPSLVVLSLVAIGIMDFTTQTHKFRIWLTGLLSMVGLLFIGILFSEMVVIYAAGLSLVAILLIWLGIKAFPDLFTNPTIPLILFLIVGLILHGPFQGIDRTNPNLPPEEQALLFMIDELPVGTRVLAGSPGVIYAARMTYMGIASTDVPIFSSSEEFRTWLNSQNVDAIYIDRTFTVDNNAYWILLQQLADEYQTEFIAQSSEIQVWIKRD